ncbi:Prolyl 4-hydroxylase subunit alpha-2 isoform A [Chlorella sorokiniana]|uniref:procollagen-proline 4-dioxygenase n=1 Tax=Chlorella sorokiniana TaxID=3076 RepID=A0A2P6TFL1_CHLSO|nr:Prolyl 4-hydroxylase subunit alpha-2 isoform A [Chlorella sorokiniana]|eukprot:PRW32905.1 Prolyl 4-hydroxylase subunit alpha-2 isoform A [Chlorella sorokiniana]
MITRHRLVLLLVAGVLLGAASGQPSDSHNWTRNSTSDPVTPEQCAYYFQEREPSFSRCRTELDRAATANSTNCPDQCLNLLEGVPRDCVRAVKQSLDQSAFREPAEQNSENPFDICRTSLCDPDSNRHCLVTVKAVLVLQPLWLLQNPANSVWASLNGDPIRNTPPDSGDGSVSVGAIIGGVIAGNVVVLACVVGFVWLRRRRMHRMQQQQLQLQLGSVAAGGSTKLGSELSGDGLPSWKARPNADIDSAEAGISKEPTPRPTLNATAVGLGPSPLGRSSAGSVIPAGAPQPEPAPTDGADHVAALWASAAQAAAATQQQQQARPSGQQQGGAEGGSQPSSFRTSLPSTVPSSRPSGSSAAESPGRRPPLGLVPSRRGSAMLSQRGSSTLVDLTPWEVKYSDLTILRPLGEGSYGKVYLASMRETLCAVKLLLSTEDAAAAVRSGESSISLSSPVMQALQKECGLMASLRHPNVVLFLGLCYSPPAIVTEYCSRGSLFDCLRAASQAEGAAAQLSWTRRLNMALDAAKGVLALHSHSPPMVHRDLKSPNLLVDQGWKIKICDFNLSKLIEESTRSSSVGGMLNPRWLAPEVLTGGSATAASDVFSFGVVLWELLTWAIPWEGVNAFQLVFMVSSGDRLAMPALEALPGKPPEPAVYDAYVALGDAAMEVEPAAVAAAVAPAAAAAAGAPEQQQQQAAAAAAPPPHFAYSPEHQCDLIIKTADGKRIGVHRLIVLRVAGFFKELLDACAENEVSVPETFTVFKGRLLDLIYDRAVQIQPAAALQVFQLADKYEAPSLMEACRAVFNSTAFKPRLRRPDGSVLLEGHADWLEVLALASKHGYQELFDKCTTFMKTVSKLPATAADALTCFIQGAQQLKELRQDHMFDLMVVFAQCTQAAQTELRQEKARVEEEAAESKRAVEEITKQLNTKTTAYAKLLQKHNRLVAACDKHGVSWHRELDGKDKKRKRGGQQAQQGGAAAAAAAAAPAAAAVDALDVEGFLAGFEIGALAPAPDSKRPWMQVLDAEARIFLFHNFLTEAECDHIVGLAKPKMERSGVVDTKTGNSDISDIRTSSGTFLERGQDDVIAGIEERIARWTLLPVGNGEGLQVLHYSKNQEYQAHWDYFFDEKNVANGGNRYATVLMYLNDVEEGGETVFPNIPAPGGDNGPEFSECARKHLAAKPRKGAAVLFHSIKTTGELEKKSLHTACPVIKGEKWSAPKWIHVGHYAMGNETPMAVKQHIQKVGGPSGPCEDKDVNCDAWASTGECEKNPVFMIGNRAVPGSCVKACGMCDQIYTNSEEQQATA